MNNLYSLPNLLTAFFISLLGFFSYFAKKKTSTNRYFLFVCLSATIWLFFSFLAYNSTSENSAYFYMKISYFGIIYIPVTSYSFVVNFLNKKNWLGISIAFWLIAFFFSIILFSSTLLISSVYKYFWGYYPIAGYFHPIFLAFFILPIILSIVFLFYYTLKKDTPSLRKKQIIYVLMAFFVFSLASVDFIANYRVTFFPFGFAPTFVFLSTITYSIIKYRLLDISVVLTRSTIFIIVYSLVLGFPFLSAFNFKDYFYAMLQHNWWIIPLLISTFLATTGPFIYVYIQKKAEEKLLKEQRSYQTILRNASSGMIRIKDLKRLLNVVVHVVTKTVKIRYAAIYLLDKEPNDFILQAARGRSRPDKRLDYIDLGSPLVWQLSSKMKPIVTEEEVMKLRDDSQNTLLTKLVEELKLLDVALVVPSFVEDRLIGILMLGEKKSGKLYSEDDLVVFSVLANQAALAIENAQFYDEVKRTHEQLFQAEKMATIGTMADGLSHQINNRFHALSLISGDALDILKTYDPSNCSGETRQVLSDLKSSLERIEANVLQGGEVVKGLLKYSRPGESGFELIDFRDVLKGAIDMVQYKIKLKEIDLIQNLPNDLSKFHGNLTQLQEVFFNLIDNAYDATKERQATLKEEGFKSRIEIAARNVDGSLEITVADNGMGVKDLDKKKLFTPFFTTKATAKKGTGLGLYVIDKIITSHNGKIAIDSVYQSGTSFTITLPISPKAV